MSTIRKIETFATEFLCFVRVTDDQGVIGWGQTAPYNADITAQIIHRQIAPWALGQQIDNFGHIIDTIERREHKFPGSYRSRAVAGLDTALWDLIGRKQGKPVVELLGGSAGLLRCYGSSMKRDITPQDEADRLSRLCDTHGFDAVKFRIGAECGNDIDQWPGRTEDIIAKMSHALRGRADLLVDANSAFRPERAISIGHMLQDHGISHYEEPVPYWDLDATKVVTDALDIDVTGGEQDWDMQTWKRMIEMRAVDVIQPDVMYVGGIHNTVKVAAMAAEHNIPCTLHAANLSLVTVCSMHVMKAIPNAGKYLEFSIEEDDYYPWQNGIFQSNPFTIKDGHIKITDTPGWGVDIHPEWLDAAQYAVSDAENWEPSAYGQLYGTPPA